MLSIMLPWPPHILNPNNPAHWSKKYKAKKNYKEACWAIAKTVTPQFPEEGRIKFELIFVPAIRRVRDYDNMVASMKSGLDGVALAWNVNDSRFTFDVEIREAEKPGYVILKQAEDDGW